MVRVFRKKGSKPDSDDRIKITSTSRFSFLKRFGSCTLAGFGRNGRRMANLFPDLGQGILDARDPMLYSPMRKRGFGGSSVLARKAIFWVMIIVSGSGSFSISVQPAKC